MRKNKSYKYFSLIILTLLVMLVFYSIAYSSEAETNQTKENLKEVNKKTQKINNNYKQFIPSEKIKADSSVSFPVDI